METYYIGYEDDGPSGAGGQSVSRTAPWRKLYIFTDYQVAKDFANRVTEGPFSLGRTRPRITGFWTEAEGYEDVKRME